MHVVLHCCQELRVDVDERKRKYYLECGCGELGFVQKMKKGGLKIFVRKNVIRKRGSRVDVSFICNCGEANSRNNNLKRGSYNLKCDRCESTRGFMKIQNGGISVYSLYPYLEIIGGLKSENPILIVSNPNK
jgi:hypothetical protein